MTQKKYDQLPPLEKLNQIAIAEQASESDASKFRAECANDRAEALSEYIDQLFKEHFEKKRGLRPASEPSSTQPVVPQPSGQSDPCTTVTPQQFQDWREMAPPKGSAVDVHGQLRVDGRRGLVDKNNQQVRLQGMSLFWSQWMGKYYNGEVVKWLASDWHANLIRIAVAADETFQPNQRGYLFDKKAEEKKIEAVVRGCVEAGIYCIIDWHCEGPQSSWEPAKEFFEKMSKKYGKLENVMFETWNEPTHDDWVGKLQPYHETVVGIIREHSQNVCICGTPQWSSQPGTASQYPVNQPNVAYTVHFYAGTHHDRSQVQTALNNNCAVVCTEWGMPNASAKGPLDYGSTQQWMDFFEQNNISSANWAVSDKVGDPNDPETASALKQGASETGHWKPDQLTESGSYVRKYIRSKNPPAPKADLITV